MPAGATYEPLATTTLTSDQATITLSSISSSYTDLRVVINSISADTGTYIVYQYNSDTGSNYSTTQLVGNGSAASSPRGSNNTFNRALYQSWQDTNGVALCIIDIFSYAGSTNKTSLAVASNDKNGSGTVERNVSLWRNTAAINSITFRTDSGGSYKTGTTVTLYGIARA
jgi:hypothetical protein